MKCVHRYFSYAYQNVLYNSRIKYAIWFVCLCLCIAWLLHIHCSHSAHCVQHKYYGTKNQLISFVLTVQHSRAQHLLSVFCVCDIGWVCVCVFVVRTKIRIGYVHCALCSMDVVSRRKTDCKGVLECVCVCA